jgi:Ca2+-binding RTX toxin-like protein
LRFSVRVSRTAPVVSSQTAEFRLQLDEAVTVADPGGLTLSLSDGAHATFDQAVSTATTLVFTYTVGIGDIAADLSVTDVHLGGAAVKDAAGNLADLTGAVANPAGTLAIDGADGTNGGDVFNGRGGEDTIFGHGGHDSLTGGAGADRLYVGGGRDVFVFERLSDSTVKSGGRDTILRLGVGDRIDLSAIDSDTKTRGHQAFSFIGTDSFDGKAGELRYVRDGQHTYVYADSDGDRHADFAFELDKAINLDRHDFVF